MSSFACKGTSYCLFHHAFSFFLFPHEGEICSLSHHFMLFDKMLPKRSLSTAKMLLSIITTVPHCKLSSIGDSMTNVCFAIHRESYKNIIEKQVETFSICTVETLCCFLPQCGQLKKHGKNQIKSKKTCFFLFLFCLLPAGQ